MPFNPSGVFQRLYRWVTDRDNSIPIDSTRMDAEIDGMVTGINAIVSQTQAFTGPVLLGDEWPAVKQALDDTAQALGLRARVATNSRTFGRQQFGQMLDDSLEPGAIAKGEPIATAKGVWQLMMGSAPEQIQRAKGAVRNELADVLTRPNAQNILDTIERARSAFPLIPDAGRGVANAVLGAGIGSTPTLAEQLRKRLLQR